ncbi:MAG: hypothetical protein AAF664_11730, partial [Planctomycetota bacterium]
MNHQIDLSNQKNPVTETQEEVVAKVVDPLVVRMLARLTQPESIRWLLICGAATVLGSSLMLVNQSWDEWSGAIQFVVVMAYTVSIYVASQFVDRRL